MSARDRLLTFAQAAEDCGCSVKTLRRRCAVLEAIAKEYNDFILHHSGGGDFDTFMAELYPAETKESRE